MRHRSRNRECRNRNHADTCTLECLSRGDRCRVLGIDDERVRGQAIRFGMGEGSMVSCVTKLPAGPVVLRSGRQEIAIGRQLARRIRIERLDANGVAC